MPCVNGCLWFSASVPQGTHSPASPGHTCVNTLEWISSLHLECVKTVLGHKRCTRRTNLIVDVFEIVVDVTCTPAHSSARTKCLKCKYLFQKEQSYRRKRRIHIRGKLLVFRLGLPFCVGAIQLHQTIGPASRLASRTGPATHVHLKASRHHGNPRAGAVIRHNKRQLDSMAAQRTSIQRTQWAAVTKHNGQCNNTMGDIGTAQGDAVAHQHGTPRATDTAHQNAVAQ